MCAIAGAYCEFVPVVHIVGYPTEAAMHGRNIMHHSLGEVGDGKFEFVIPSPFLFWGGDGWGSGKKGEEG